MLKTAPLVKRALDDPIAWLTKPLACLHQTSGAISVNQFLSHVHQLAEQLPDKRHAINLCDNRYLFMLGLCASIIRGQTVLLPSNKNVATQNQLLERYQGSYILHDGIAETSASEQTNIVISSFTRTETQQAIPQIALDHIAVISFTSGSTGEAKPNIKTWRTLVDSTAINSRYMLPNQQQTFYHLAAVPGQHMWGFETSVLMAMFAKVCTVDARPLYADDIRELLEDLPQPRTLIGTPLHLRAIDSSNLTLPAMVSILSATAPLSQQLAKAIESKLQTEVREVYGCSEVGSMAIRRTAENDQWEKFNGLNFESDKQGSITVSAEHLREQTRLEDNLQMLDETHFKLAGRSSDQIKIAGKRGSLEEVNKVLMTFPKLNDGIVFFPPQERAVPRLVALVVMEKGLNKKELRKHMQKHLDAAFVPRPIIQVPCLPRAESGKLIKADLLKFYQDQLKKHRNFANSNLSAIIP